jgi:hypothetical protein
MEEIHTQVKAKVESSHGRRRQERYRPADINGRHHLDKIEK